MCTIHRVISKSLCFEITFLVEIDIRRYFVNMHVHYFKKNLVFMYSNITHFLLSFFWDENLPVLEPQVVKLLHKWHSMSTVVPHLRRSHPTLCQDHAGWPHFLHPFWCYGMLHWQQATLPWPTLPIFGAALYAYPSITLWKTLGQKVGWSCRVIWWCKVLRAIYEEEEERNQKTTQKVKKDKKSKSKRRRSTACKHYIHKEDMNKEKRN